MPHSSLDEKIILRMIAAYGNDLKNWPDRKAAHALLNMDNIPETITSAMNGARELDAVLAQDELVAPPSEALTAHIAQMAMKATVWRPHLIWAFLMAFLTSAGVAYAQTRNASESELATLSMLDYGASIADETLLIEDNNTGDRP